MVLLGKLAYTVNENYRRLSVKAVNMMMGWHPVNFTLRREFLLPFVCVCVCVCVHCTYTYLFPAKDKLLFTPWGCVPSHMTAILGCGEPN